MLNTNYRDVIEETVGEITQSNYQISFIEKAKSRVLVKLLAKRKRHF